MNWFKFYFVDQAITGEGFMVNMGIYLGSVLSIILLFAGFILAYRKRMTLNSVLAVIVLGFSFKVYFDGSLTPLSGIIPDPIGRIPLIMWIIIVSFILGFFLTASIAMKKKRSVDRFIIGLSLVVCSFLTYSYHVVLINGFMNSSLISHEAVLEKGLWMSDKTFSEVCESMEWICKEGETKDFEPKLGSPLGDKYFESVHSTYKKNVGDEFSLADHASFILEETSYVFAYKQDADNYRFISRTMMKDLEFNSGKISFNLFYNAVFIFWCSLSFFIIWFHNKVAFRKRTIKSDTNKISEK